MELTQNEKENLIRWKAGDKGGHVESFFLKANAPLGGKALWIKFTIYSPVGRPEQTVAESWAICFDGETGKHVAVKSAIPIGQAALGYERFNLVFGPSALRAGHTEGRIETGDDSISWKLSFSRSSRVLKPFPLEKMYEWPLPKSKLVSPYPNEIFEGEMEVNGQKIQVKQWPGMQGHNWGKQHAERYAWVHCNAFQSDPADTFFEGLSAQVKVGPFTTPLLTLLCLRHRGEDIFFRGVRNLLNKKVRLDYTSWRFKADNGKYILEGTFEAPREDMVGLYYANPDGSMTHCLNSKIARGRLDLTSRENGAKVCLSAPRHAALEVATKDAAHGVKMYV